MYAYQVINKILTSEDGSAQFSSDGAWVVVGLLYFISIVWIISYIKLLKTPIGSTYYAEDGDPDIRCTECNIKKRPDIVHCSTCLDCVEGHDHHCGVAGICIGDANFKYFIGF